jgi:large exoprotein involved in heme utilization and adhesion
LFTQAYSGASGNAGDLTINTGSLLVRDGAVVSAGTFGQGDGGSIYINTGSLSVSNGAQLNVKRIDQLETRDRVSRMAGR